VTACKLRKVCVVGGGPAGLAAAIALRLQSCEVSVFDRAVPPIDKACGEALLPDAVHALQGLGVRIPAKTGVALHGICFIDGAARVAAEFPSRIAIGIRRTTLHSSLVERAKELGINLHWGVKRVRYANGDLSVDGRALRPDLVVGADGQNSTVRSGGKLGEGQAEKRRFGFRQHFAVAPWAQHVELHWGKTCQLYTTPVGEREVGVALLSSDPKLRLAEALVQFPTVWERVRGAAARSEQRGAVTISRTLSRVCAPGVALVGDASGSVDAITGEGLGLAVRQAVALAQAWRDNELEAYQMAHKHLARRPREMARALLLLGRYPALRIRALRTFIRHPDVFARLLAVHVGEARFRELCNWPTLHAGARFLFA
jgi:flavin-dependent dehydrogenase